MLSHIKLGKAMITFGDNEVEKHKFHQRKTPNLISDVNMNKIAVPNKIFLWQKKPLNI